MGVLFRGRRFVVYFTNEQQDYQKAVTDVQDCARIVETFELSARYRVFADEIAARKQNLAAARCVSNKHAQTNSRLGIKTYSAACIEKRCKNALVRSRAPASRKFFKLRR